MANFSVVTVVVLGVGIVVLAVVLVVLFVHLRRFSAVRTAVQARLLDDLATLKARRAALGVAVRDQRAGRHTDR